MTIDDRDWGGGRVPSIPQGNRGASTAGAASADFLRNTDSFQSKVVIFAEAILEAVSFASRRRQAGVHIQRDRGPLFGSDCFIGKSKFSPDPFIA